MLACRSNLPRNIREQGQNAGLLLDKYLRVAYKDEGHSEDRKELFQAAIKACRQPVALYQKAYDRWQEAVAGEEQLLQVRGKLIVGLGNESILETGFTFNHTYGTPLISGSALKGLARHYCSQVWGQEDARFKEEGENHKALFGTADYGGHITFHDAWIEPSSLSHGLTEDVMTPHHSDYYGGKKENGDVLPPSDFDDPIPVTFLAVTGKFRIIVKCDDLSEAGKKWEQLAMRLLVDALKNWGIGGKTSSDYGKLVAEGEIEPIQVEDSATEAGRAAPRRHAGLQNRDKVVATRIEDPKGKARVFFATSDGHRGPVTDGEPPDIEIGETCELWIKAIISSKACNFSDAPPPPPKIKQQRGNQRRGNQHR